MNKEIEEAKHELKGIANNEFVPPELSDIDAKILLSYIEQLEKENKKLKQWDKNKDTRNSRQRIANALLMKKNKQLEKRNKQIYEGFMATQEELTDYAMKNEQLEADYKEANDSITWWNNRFNALNKEYKLLKDRNEINIDRNIEAYRIVEQLENNRDKAIEYIENYFIFNDKTGECYQTHTFDKDNVKKLYDILKGDSDE